MQTQSLSLWWLRIATFLTAALAAASATYWVLKWSASAPSAPIAQAVFSPPVQTDPQVVARLLGGGLSTVAATLVDSAASHFKLTGVVASRAHNGYALISVDGKPARPYRVGTSVNDALVLHSVAARSADLATSLDGPVAFTLELPKPGAQ
jgi:general secretion pathway protein C